MVIKHIHRVQRGIPYHHEPCLACCSAFRHCDQIPEIIKLDGEKVCFNSVMEEGSSSWPGGFIAFKPVARQATVAGARGDGNLGARKRKKSLGQHYHQTHSSSVHFLPVGPYRFYHHP